MKDACLSEDDWIQTRLDQLNLIDEKRLIAICHGQTYLLYPKIFPLMFPMIFPYMVGHKPFPKERENW